MQQLANINLNLLVPLKALLETESVTLAAERLGVTQPTMSRHVAQLRTMFNDPLLVRTGSRYARTARATELLESLGPTLEQMENLFRVESDPATTPRDFLIAAPDVVSVYVLGEAMAEMLSTAGNFRVSLLNWTSEAKRRLLEGEIHLAISIDDVFSPNMYRAQVGVDRWVCLMRKDHPLSRSEQPLGIEEILAWGHVRAHTGGGRDKQVDAWMHRNGIQREIRLSTEGYLPLCPVLLHTDFIAIVPWHQARMNSRLFELTFAPLAIDLPDVVYSIWWHERYQHDRGHRRLREMILPRIRDHPAHEGIFGRGASSQ
jgi:DNA-binding transcriptional LysR family regulator